MPAFRGNNYLVGQNWAMYECHTGSGLVKT